jgi:hypothetical protein
MIYRKGDIMKKRIVYEMKSRKKLVGAIVVIVICAGLVSVYVPPAITGQSIIVKTSLSDVDHANVYYFKNILINETLAREIASKFGFYGEPDIGQGSVLTNTKAYDWENNSKTFEIYEYSGVFFLSCMVQRKGAWCFT